jgi:hypothetical protein
MRVMNEALTVGLGTSPAVSGSMLGASGVGTARTMFSSCMDDSLVHSSTHLRRRCWRSSAGASFWRRALSASSDGRSSVSSATAARGRATSCAEVRGFTGLANYYRLFVAGCAELAAPLTALGGPAARFAWTPTAQASLDALKWALSTAPVLHTFDPGSRAVRRRTRAA